MLVYQLNKRIIALVVLSLFSFSFFVPNTLGLLKSTYSQTNNSTLYVNTPYDFTGTFYNTSDYTQTFSNAYINFTNKANNSISYRYNFTASELSNHNDIFPNSSNIILNQGIYDNGSYMMVDDNNYTSFLSTNNQDYSFSNYSLYNGSLYQIGNLANQDNNFSMFKSVFNNTKYYASFSFDNIPNGSNHPNFTYSGNTKVIGQYTNHSKVYLMEYESSQATLSNYFYHQTNATIEFWWLVNDTTKDCRVIIKDDSSNQILLRINSGVLRYAKGGGVYETICNIKQNNWVHIRLDISAGSVHYKGLGTNQFYIYVNGIQYGAYNLLQSTNYFSLFTIQSTNIDSFTCLDAIGFTFYSNYSIGQNINPIIEINDINVIYNISVNPNLITNKYYPRLSYSYRTNSSNIQMSIYNNSLSNWQLIDNSIYSTFSTHYFNMSSDYVDSFNRTFIKFNSIYSNLYNISIDLLRINIADLLNFSLSFNYTMTDILIFNVISRMFTNISVNIDIGLFNYNTSAFDIIGNNFNHITEYLFSWTNITILNEYINNNSILVNLNGINYNPFNLSIDLLSISDYHKTVLTKSFTFDSIGIWQYRFVLNEGLPNEYSQNWFTLIIVIPDWLNLGVPIPWYAFLIAFVLATVIGLWYKRTFITSKKQLVKFWFGLIALDTLLFCCGINSIAIYLTVGNNVSNSSWIFTLLNALIFGVYLNIIGYGGGNIFKRNALRTLLLVVLVILCFSGFGYFGLLVKFNFPFNLLFFYDIFSTGTVHGIRFLSFNILLFIVILFFSFLLEREVDG